MNLLPSDYNWEEYIYLNPDLQGMNENDAYYHYTGYGACEKRKYKFDVPTNFNWNEYVENNDLNINNKFDARKHYHENKKIIFNKKKILEKKFNYIEYVESHNDLSSFNKEDSIKHYNINGYKESRTYILYNISRIFIIDTQIQSLNDVANIFQIKINDKKKLYDIEFKKNDIILFNINNNLNISTNDILYIINISINNSKDVIKLILFIDNSDDINKCANIIDKTYKIINKSDIIDNEEYYKLYYEPIYKKNIIIITSKIYTSNNSFSYVNHRSIYSKDERLSQTINTINSIRNKIPNSYIVLFDNSEFDNNEYDLLDNHVDQFINITDNGELNYYTNEYEYKAFAEIFQIITLYDVFLKKVDSKMINNIFKITGRYVLNDQFNYNNYDNENNDKNIFKRDYNLCHMKYYYTCFYKISRNFLHEYFKILLETFNHKDYYVNKNLEEIIPEVINYNFTEFQELGITQYISVFNEINNI
jgi:hypothetical protein